MGASPPYIEDPQRKGVPITHWHGCHQQDRRGATNNKKDLSRAYLRFLAGFPEIAKDAKRLGVEIINTSMVSKITQFPKIPLTEVMK